MAESDHISRSLVTINITQPQGSIEVLDSVIDQVHVHTDTSGQEHGGSIHSDDATDNAIQRQDLEASELPVAEKDRISDTVTKEISCTRSQIMPEDEAHKIFFFLQEKSEFLFKSKKFAESLKLLQKLLPLQMNIWCKLKTQVMISECLIRCGTKLNAVREIDKAIELVKAQSCIRVEDVIYLAREWYNQDHRIRSMILHQCACKLYKTASNSNEAVTGMMQSFRSICTIAKDLHRSFDEAKDSASYLSVLFMEDKLEDLRSIDGVDPRVRVENEVICMNNIGMVYSALGNYDEADAYYESGINALESVFKDTASNFYVYGGLLNNRGTVAHAKMLTKKAKEYYEKSMDAYRKAKNFPNENLRESWIQDTNRNLKNL